MEKRAKLLLLICLGAAAAVAAQTAGSGQTSNRADTLALTNAALRTLDVVVLSAGRFDSTELPGAEELSFDVSDFFRVLRRHGATAHADLVNGSTAGNLVLADASPHCIHCVAPELVARAIERVLTPGGGASASSDTVHVAAPTGNQANDRASILDAIERVRPGSTVQFAPGTYLIGGIIRIPTDEITLLGHARGTVIRGCEPDAFPEPREAYFACHGFELAGARQTVRNLTFEYTWHGLFVGCCFPADEEALEFGGVGPLRSQPGGHLIESNTFRYTPNGLRVIGESVEPTVVRDNRFIDVYHAVQINGGAVHVLDNDIGVRDPERVPTTNYPGDAINILPFSSMLDLLQSPTEDHTSCSGNVIARNRIEGYPDGIRIMVPDPRTSCRRNEIRDNTIVVERARWVDIENGPRITDAADSTIVGVPLRLSNWARAGAAEGEDAHDARIEDNLIEGNRVIGAEGVGIEVLHASGNRIANNTLTAVERRDAFPGNTLGGEPERWREANGSGIWLSPGSDENEIEGNRFEDIAAFAVVVEGNGNRVELPDAAAAVRDLGTGNRMTDPDTTTSPPPYKNRFLDAGGVPLHYLDFGGEGLPVVFVHSEGWDAHTYAEFAPRFADRNRVLAVTRPGYGQSEPHPDGFGVEVQARSLIDFLDALEIERAVFAGNASATAELTFLGEHHADRVEGLIYFTGLAVLWLEELDSDPTRAFEMYWRASPGGGDFAERYRARGAYRPEHLRADRPTIPVPALAFVARSGTMANERGIGALALVGSPWMADMLTQMPTSPGRDHLERLASDESYRTRQLEQIEDPEAREYFLRLAADPEFQETMYRYHEEVVLPALRAAQERFRRAFADDLRLVRLEVDQVVGYEYRDAPELIEPHIRRFLEELEPVGQDPQDTTRYTIIINGHRQSERRMWQEGPDTWRYEHEGDAFHFPRTERLVDAGVYTLEVETVHYSASGLPPSLQRVAFGVGEVAEAALTEAARVAPPAAPPADTVPVVAMSEAELRRFEGVFTAPGVPIEFTVAMAGPELTMAATGQAPGLLAPLGGGVFRWEDPAALRAGRPFPRVSFSSERDGLALTVFGVTLTRAGR